MKATRTMSGTPRTEPSTAPIAVNEVHLVGRVAADAVRRELPSGDEVVTLRLVVAREPAAATGGARVDTIDCAVWSTALRRRVAGWRVDDVVDVRGALRRRFFRAGGAAAVSRYEVEVASARMLRRARRPATG